MTTKVYIAARGEDQALAAQVRAQLSLAGIACTARWIDQSLANESHDEAQQDLDDVRSADALILLKPAGSHRHTTGGHHVETGVALERGLPIVLLGEPENVFHRHRSVTVLSFPRDHRGFANVASITRSLAQMATDASPVMLAVMAERQRQDAQWGGPKHDDTHTLRDWFFFINHQIAHYLHRRQGARMTLIKIAALCFAAVESIDRKEASR